MARELAQRAFKISPGDAQSAILSGGSWCSKGKPRRPWRTSTRPICGDRKTLICSMTFSSASLSRSLGRWRVCLARDVPHVSRRILIARKSAIAERLTSWATKGGASGNICHRPYNAPRALR
jgi:hypothetical protein